jgi:DNA-directed RNA polymerase specialized sigma24 family protein
LFGLPWDSNHSYNCLADSSAPVWKQMLLEDRQTPVPDQAAFRIDWSAFLRDQHPRTRTALALLAAGHKQNEIADRLGVTPSAVSQRIKRAEREWTLSQDGQVPAARSERRAAAQPAA